MLKLLGTTCGEVLLKTSSCGRFYSSALPIMRQQIADQLEEIRHAGTFKSERVITSKQDNLITVEGSDQPVLNFCANNYLGLSSHPEVVQAGIDALKSHASGLSSVRFICGTNDLHLKLEKQISDFHGRDDTILYSSCFDANAGLFEVLLSEHDEVYSDSLNHASVIDGIRLCKAKKHRYKHMDMEDLEHQLRHSKGTHNRKLIVSDGVFSMDGNVAPLKDICYLAEKYNCLTMIDECHSTGFFGETGKGTEEFHGVEGQITIITSTLGKALGGASGGYTTGPKELISLLRQKSRPYLFSNALPPPVVAGASKVFDLLSRDHNLADRVHSNTARFRKAMTAAGFDLAGDRQHPICPVMLGDARLSQVFADKMLERGIYVIGFNFPVVPRGEARIRVQISACHTEEDIDRAVEAFTAVGKELHVIE